MPSRRFDKRPRLVRKRRVRVKVNGTPERLRLSVFRSNKHIHGQIINDVVGNTLVHASSVEKGLVPKNTQGKIAVAEIVGTTLAMRAKEAKIKKVVFDKGGYKYHGRIKQLAEAARKVGLEF